MTQPAHTRRMIAAAIANVKHLGHDARSYEGSSAASAALSRLHTLDQMYGDLFQAIDEGNEAFAYDLIDRLITERHPEQDTTP